MESFHARVVQDEKARPEEEDVQEADQAEEEGHVDAGFVADARFHEHRVDAVHDGAHEREAVADGELPGGFFGKVAAVVGVVVAAAEVDGADEGDAGEGGEDGEQFAECEALDAQEGAEEEGEDAAGAGEDGAGGDGRVFEAGGDEVVGCEPEEAEF